MPALSRARQHKAIIAALLVGAGMVLGGGGSPAPLAEMALQCLAALALASWIVASRASWPFLDAAPVAWSVAGLVLVVPLIQLVPLPPAIWHALPGRELERAALGLVGAADTWRPISLTPGRTFAALLAMASATIVILMTAALGRGGRALVVGMIACVALLAMVVGAGQIASGESGALRFYPADGGYLNGFQANHNAAADVFLIGMVAAAATIRELAERRGGRDARRPAAGFVLGAIVLFALATFFTASRAGLLLLPVAFAGSALIALPRPRISRRGAILAAGAIVLAGAAAVWLALANPLVARVLSRFDFANDFRLAIWRDSIFSLQVYFPWGSGMGSFIPVFQAIERLEIVNTTLVNRAHNDFIELGVETGLLGALVLAFLTARLGPLAWKGWRRPPAGSRGQHLFAITGLAVIALHSQVDYPLRSMSLAFIAAVCAGLLMPLADRGLAANVDE